MNEVKEVKKRHKEYYSGIKRENTRSALVINKVFYQLCKDVARNDGRSFSSLCVKALKEYMINHGVEGYEEEE